MQMSTFGIVSTGHHLVAFIFVAVNLGTAVRLMCYRRKGAKYRLGMSVIAYLMVVFTGGQGLDVLIRQGQLGNWVGCVSLWQLGIAVLLAILVFRAHGNVAAIGKPTRARVR